MGVALESEMFSTEATEYVVKSGVTGLLTVIMTGTVLLLVTVCM